VVGGATQIEVSLSDGTQYPATVVGVDPKTDLGVIKISSAKPLPFINVANSDEAKVGQWVVAIGHPRGLDQTVTQGIISAKHRTGTGIGRIGIAGHLYFWIAHPNTSMGSSDFQTQRQL